MQALLYFIDDEVDDSKGENANNEANDGIEDSVTGFFDFASIADGGHVAYPADNDKNYGDDADEADDNVNNIDNSVGESV